MTAIIHGTTDERDRQTNGRCRYTVLCTATSAEKQTSPAGQRIQPVHSESSRNAH